MTDVTHPSIIALAGVIPAQAGIQGVLSSCSEAIRRGVIPAQAGIQGVGCADRFKARA